MIYFFNFVFSKEVMVCFYVFKKNKVVIMLLLMYMLLVIESNKEIVKLDIILYYNKIKSGVDNMDKLIVEYIVKCRMNWWFLVFFFNIIDIVVLVVYIIYMEYNL